MFHKLTSNDTEQAELAKVEYLLFILVLFSGKTRSNSLCFNSDSRNPTKSCPFPTWIPEIRPHYYPFLSGFLKSNTIMCAVKVGFQKSEVAGSVSCSDSWNPGHCGALLSGISQMVGNFGALSIILMELRIGAYRCYSTETLRMTKAPSPSPSLKSKEVGMVSKGSKVSVKSV